MPKRLAPNMITLVGAVVPVISFTWLIMHDMTMKEILPASVLILNAFGIFWYQTMDAVDGKHARATDNCSCLG